MKQTETAHAIKTRGQFKYNRAQILYLTGMDDQQFNNFQIDTAKAWVERYWQNLLDIDTLLNCVEFWRWWMYQWNLVDDRAIIQNLYVVHSNQRLAAYRQMHQYVFDGSDHLSELLSADFRAMRKDFDKAIKENKK